jgi:hypothetical protein
MTSHSLAGQQTKRFHFAVARELFSRVSDIYEAMMYGANITVFANHEQKSLSHREPLKFIRHTPRRRLLSCSDGKTISISEPELFSAFTRVVDELNDP